MPSGKVIKNLFNLLKAEQGYVVPVCIVMRVEPGIAYAAATT
jgi:hypothetical protein